MMGRNKRPRELQFGQLDPQSGAKKRQKGSGHVQNALDQDLHEASARSDDLSSLTLASSVQTSLPATESSPSKTFIETIHRVPQVKQRRPSKPHIQQEKSAKLPQLPPIQDKNLEEAVFTRQSYLSGNNQDKLNRSYDRLEFLGDAYIEVIASQLLYSSYPHMPAGRLSQQRENLVKNEALAAHSLAYGFDKRARLQRGVSNTTTCEAKNRHNSSMRQASQNPFNTAPLGADTRSNHVKIEHPSNWHQSGSHTPKGQQKDLRKQEQKILGDIFEAYVAAIVLSNTANGYRTAEAWLHKLWIPKLEGQNPAETRAPPPAGAKNELAKRVMGKGIRLEYRDVAPPDLSESMAGKIWYTVGVFLTGWGWNQIQLGEGRALNKNQAGTMAATQALETPLTEQISKVKKAFDITVAEERAAKERQSQQDEKMWDAGESSDAVRVTSPKSIEREEEDESGDGSQSADSNDSDDSEGFDRP